MCKWNRNYYKLCLIATNNTENIVYQYSTVYQYQLLTTTFNFDSKLTVDKAKLLNAYSGQKVYRFWLIKCSSAGIFPCTNQHLPKITSSLHCSQEASKLLAQTRASCPKGWQPPAPSPVGLGLASRPQGMDISSYISYMNTTSTSAEEGVVHQCPCWSPGQLESIPCLSLSLQCLPSTPVLQRGTLFPSQAGTQGEKHRTKKSTAHQASSHLTVFLLLPSFLIFQE